MKELSILGTRGRVLTSDQLTRDQRVTYSCLVSDSLAKSGFTIPVGAQDLALHMEAGRTVVIVKPSDEGLLAHAYLKPPDGILTELSGVFSYARGFGIPIVQQTARHAMRTAGIERVYAKVRANNPRALRTFGDSGGELIDVRVSPNTGRELAIFDLTNVGRRNL